MRMRMRMGVAFLVLCAAASPTAAGGKKKKAPAAGDVSGKMSKDPACRACEAVVSLVEFEMQRVREGVGRYGQARAGEILEQACGIVAQDQRVEVSQAACDEMLEGVEGSFEEYILGDSVEPKSVLRLCAVPCAVEKARHDRDVKEQLARADADHEAVLRQVWADALLGLAPYAAGAFVVLAYLIWWLHKLQVQQALPAKHD